MFPDVVIGFRFLVDPVTLEATVRHVFLVDAPANALRFQQVHDGLDAGTDPCESVVGDSVGISSRGSNIVWLGSEAKVSLQSLFQPSIRDGMLSGTYL